MSGGATRKKTERVALALLLGAALLAAPRDAEANPWTRDAGHFYVNLSYSRISARSLFAPDFSSQSLPDVDGDGSAEAYTQHVLALYGEVGIVDRWLTATVNAILMRRASLDLQGSTLGLGDLQVGLWSGVLTWPVRVSAGIAFGFPIGDPVPEADDGAGRRDQQTAATLPTGDGEFDVQFMLSAGYSFGGRGKTWPLSHYAIAQVGYWLRTTPRDAAFGDATDLPDAFNWRFELGTNLPLTFVDRFWLIFRVFGTEAFASKEELSMNASGLGAAIHTSWQIEVFGRIAYGLGASFAFSSAFRAAGLPAGANLKWALSYEL